MTYNTSLYKSLPIPNFVALRDMIALLVSAVSLEALTIVLLILKTPLRNVVIISLDRLKRCGVGPMLIIITLAGTLLVMLLSTLSTILSIHKPRIHDGHVGLTHQIIMANQLLQATLLGGILFNAILVDDLHLYIKELQIQRNNTEAMKREAQELESEAQEFKAKIAEEIKALKKEKARLGAELKRLEFELQASIKKSNVAKVNAVALRKQSDGFLLEYDRLLKEKQELRSQLQSLDYQKLSRSASKKNM